MKTVKNYVRRGFDFTAAFILKVIEFSIDFYINYKIFVSRISYNGKSQEIPIR